MDDAPRPAERERDPADTRRRNQEGLDEWRLWRTFGLGLAFLIFALVVIATSL